MCLLENQPVNPLHLSTVRMLQLPRLFHRQLRHLTTLSSSLCSIIPMAEVHRNIWEDTKGFVASRSALLWSDGKINCFSPGYYGNNLVWHAAPIKSTASKHEVLSEVDIVTCRSRYLCNECNFLWIPSPNYFFYPISHWLPHYFHFSDHNEHETLLLHLLW